MNHSSVTTEKEIQLWDIRQLLTNKNPFLSKLLPPFILNYAERKMHQDEINEALVKFQHLKNFIWIDSVLSYLDIRIETYGEDRIPLEGRNTFIGNHPSGSNDGIAYFSTIGKYFPMVKSISNSFLDYFPNIKDLYVPVNMLGNQNKQSLQAIESLYSSDDQVLHFPAGVVSRRLDGTIKDLDWKKSFVSKSIQHQRTIVPAYLDARNSDFFYRLSNFRKNLGVKQPIEQFFLIDEMFKNRNKPIKFIFGSPIRPEELTKDKRHAEWALLIRTYTYSLKRQPDRTFQEFLKSKDSISVCSK